MLLLRVSALFLLLSLLIHQGTAVFSLLGGFGAAGTTSVAISTAGAAAAVGGLAVAAAGVAGLGLAALAFGAKGGGNRGKDYKVYQYGGNDHHGHDGYGHSSSYGGYSHGYGHDHHHHRRRRATGGLSEGDNRLAKMFSVVATMDSYGCGLKLVCDLYRTPDQRLTRRERAVKDLLGAEHKVQSTHDPRFAYVTAAALGTQGYDCTQIYAKCPLTKRQVKDYLNSLSI